MVAEVAGKKSHVLTFQGLCRFQRFAHDMLLKVLLLTRVDGMSLLGKLEILRIGSMSAWSGLDM